MPEDPDERELKLLYHEFERMRQREREMLDRVTEIQKRRGKPQRRLKGLPPVAIIGTALATGWHKAASHPATSSGLVALIAVAVTSLLWLPGGSDNASDNPPVASPPTQSSTQATPPPPSSEPPDPTRDSPPTTTPGSESSEDRGAESAARWTAVPVANIEQAAPTQPGQPPERSIPEPPTPPNDRNETPPPEPPEEGPPTEEPPATQPPSTPECTGLHLDASPLAEVCLLGSHVADVELLGAD